MNRILVYTFIAVLLGIVTMSVPLAVLEPSDPLLACDDPAYSYTLESGGLERNDSFAAPESPEAAPVPEPSETIPKEPNWVEATTLSKTDAASGLSSIGLMIIPSFLIALGIFVYQKKKM